MVPGHLKHFGLMTECSILLLTKFFWQTLVQFPILTAKIFSFMAVTK